MNLFLAIMAIVIFLLVWTEKNDIRRKHLTMCYAVTVGASLLLSIVKIVTLIL